MLDISTFQGKKRIRFLFNLVCHFKKTLRPPILFELSSKEIGKKKYSTDNLKNPEYSFEGGAYISNQYKA